MSPVLKADKSVLRRVRRSKIGLSSHVTPQIRTVSNCYDPSARVNCGHYVSKNFHSVTPLSNGASCDPFVVTAASLAIPAAAEDAKFMNARVIGSEVM
jgi:hypothetical protein